MKKMMVLAAAVAVVLSAGSVMAFNLGNTVKNVATDTAKDAGKMLVVDNLNKDLKGKTAGCSCNTKTGEITGCDLPGIASRINRDQKGLQMALNRNINVKYEVAQACYDYLYSKLKPSNYNYWNWYDAKYVKTSSVKVWVD